MKNLLVFVEKPSSLKFIYKLIKHNWMNYEIKFIHLHPYINPKYIYSKGLKYKDYPYISEVKSKNDLNILPNKRVIINESNECELESYIITEQDLNEADEILYACDPCGSSAVSFQLFIDNHFISNKPVINAIKYFDFDESSIIKSIENKEEFIKLYKEEIAYGEVKKYFDYNWNLNSLVILNNIYRNLFNEDCNWISKYGLQLLYFIKDNILTEGQMIRVMNNWKGTGKYKENTRLGSSASMSKIIEDLINIDFVKLENKKLILTKDGHLFLNYIHKDAEDADLPFRLNEWCKQGIEIAKPKIDRYIKTFFGKLK